MRLILRWLVRLLYKFQACNETVLDTTGPVLLLPNHVSWWDWLLIGVCLDDDWRFVTSSTSAETSWIHKKIMVNRRTFPVDMNSPYAVKRMAEYLQGGGRLVLFPEGRISSTGSLMKLFDGTGFLIQKTKAKVITAYIRGAHRLPYSRNPDRKCWFPRVSVHFSPVLTAPRLEHVSATEGRARITDWLRDQMIRQRFETELEFGPPTIPEAIVDAARRYPGRVVMQDLTMQKVSYRRLLAGADLLAAEWRSMLGEASERVGVLLPNANAMPVVIMSLWAANKTPAILNYTSGTGILQACARVAGLKRIITSSTFVARAKLDLAPLKAAGVQVICLEEARARLGKGRRIRALLRQWIRPRYLGPRMATDQTALVLFTSGSEGDPKGVELTHRNVLANIQQMASVIDLMETDRFFNALPLFHSFGLTVGLFLPLVRGVFVFLYVSPLHYRVVPSAFYNLNCNVLFGTNTFLSGYARKAHPYDFHGLRYVIAGAEKLQENTVRVWMERFGARVLQGYGATECSPCLSVDIPMQPYPGSVGRFLPGVEHRLEPVQGVSDESGQTGRLLVRGPNIMKGYVNAEANHKFLALGGWYDTGDIAKVDPNGFLHILGRLKRFAKVSGEMVSLAAVEDALAGAFPEYGLKFTVAVVAKPDEAKGERLIAVTNETRLRLDQVREVLRAKGLSNLAVPREIRVIHELPRLGTGKVNHRELERIV